MTEGYDDGLSPPAREINNDLLSRTYKHDENWRRLQEKLHQARVDGGPQETIDAIRAELRQSKHACDRAVSQWHHETQAKLAALPEQPKKTNRIL